jgi:hypothetical protein
VAAGETYGQRLEAEMRKLLLGAGLIAAATLGLSAGAWAAPNPNPNAPAHAGTACASVLGHNPNTGPFGHSSPVGGENFGNVGAALCGLDT